ncbi:MAG: outer membrane lipoprotein carrier protein LolA [Acidobacteriota bacterium]
MWPLVLLTPILASLGSAPQPSVSLDELASRVQAYYDSLPGFEARFTQRYERRIVKKVIVETGTLAVKKPGRMRWEYQSPEEKLFLTDGEKSYFYLPEERQVIVSHAASGAMGMTHGSPFELLAGRGRLRDAFEVLPSDSEPRMGGAMLRLLPRRAQEQYEEVELEVDPDSGEVRRVVLLDTLGNQTEFLFEQVRENHRLPDSLFRFTVPSGVDIVLASETWDPSPREPIR